MMKIFIVYKKYLNKNLIIMNNLKNILIVCIIKQNNNKFMKKEKLMIYLCDIFLMIISAYVNTFNNILINI